jgi:hypothetical protein
MARISSDWWWNKLDLPCETPDDPAQKMLILESMCSCMVAIIVSAICWPRGMLLGLLDMVSGFLDEIGGKDCLACS